MIALAGGVHFETSMLLSLLMAPWKQRRITALKKLQDRFPAPRVPYVQNQRTRLVVPGILRDLTVTDIQGVRKSVAIVKRKAHLRTRKHLRAAPPPLASKRLGNPC